MNLKNMGLYIITGLLIIITLYLIYDVTISLLKYSKLIEGLEMEDEINEEEMGRQMGQEMGQEMSEEEMGRQMDPAGPHRGQEIGEEEMGQEIVMKMTAEMTEEPEEEIYEDPLEDAVNNHKTIRLRYDKNVVDAKGEFVTKPLYISVIKKDDCEFALKGSKNECDFMIAILQPNKNEFSQFIIYNQQDDKGDKYYLIRSMLDNVQPSYPYLSQILNLSNRGQNLCFGVGDDKDIKCYFEKSNLGYIITFKKLLGNETNANSENTYNDYYVTECVGDQQRLCKQGQQVFPRLCLSNNKNQAIYFQIE